MKTISFKKLKKMLMDGQISTEQYIEILIYNFEIKEFSKEMCISMEKAYDKDMLLVDSRNRGENELDPTNK